MTKEEAIKIVKDLYNKSLFLKKDKEAVRTLIPEVEEPDDEKIRKELIEFFNQFENGELRGVDITPWIAWLEKQEEQKSADKVEPKFKVGDWISNGRYTKLIIGINNDCPHYMFSDGTSEKIKDIDKKYRLWTIQYAKDGDVLSFNDGHGNDGIELIKSITDKKIEFWFCLTNGSHYEVFDGITPYTNFASREKARPATKEQRDLLFQKLKEAGYEWDAEKKELKKIDLIKAEHGKYYYCIKDYFSGCKKFSSKGDVVQALWGLPIMGLEDISEYFLPVDNIQKSAWSEEDEKIGKQLLNWFKGCNWDTIDNGTLKRDDIIAWLEERV